MSKKIKFIALFFPVSWAFLYVALPENSFAYESSDYIEVYVNDIVCVPENIESSNAMEGFVS